MNSVEVINKIIDIESEALDYQKEVDFKQSLENIKKDEAVITQLEKEREKRVLAKTREDNSQWHSKPVYTKDLIKKRIEEMERSVSLETPFVTPGESDIKASPVIYLQAKGKTYLSNSFGVKDSPESLFIEDFVLTSMESSSLEDSEASYNKILENLLNKLDLTTDHKKDFIIQKLYMYLKGKNRYDDDDIVISIMKKKLRGR